MCQSLQNLATLYRRPLIGQLDLTQRANSSFTQFFPFVNIRFNEMGNHLSHRVLYQTCLLFPLLYHSE